MTLVEQSRYRIRQFGKAVSGRLTAAERSEVEALLAPPLLRLFTAMRPGAQRHAHDVLATVRRDAPADADLWTAALLHDVAKGNLGVAPRILWVVAGLLGARRRAGIASHPRWGCALRLEPNLRHAARGAEMVAAAGGSAAAVDLIARHYESDPSDARLAALQRADGAN